MKGEALVMTIDFGNDHFNAIYLNNQLKLIASNGRMITINNSAPARPNEESTDISTNLWNFLNISHA